MDSYEIGLGDPNNPTSMSPEHQSPDFASAKNPSGIPLHSRSEFGSMAGAIQEANHPSSTSYLTINSQISQLEFQSQNRDLTPQETDSLWNLRQQRVEMEQDARGKHYLDELDLMTDELRIRVQSISSLPEGELRNSRVDAVLRDISNEKVPGVVLDVDDKDKMKGLVPFVFEREMSGLTRWAQGLRTQPSREISQLGRIQSVRDNTIDGNQYEMPFRSSTAWAEFLRKEQDGSSMKEDQFRFFLNDKNIVPVSEIRTVEARLFLMAAVEKKKQNDDPAIAYANNEALKPLNIEQLRLLCEIPGVMSGLHDYLIMVKQDIKVPGTVRSFREISSEDELKFYREQIREQIFYKLSQGVTPLRREWQDPYEALNTVQEKVAYLRQKALEAEQVAFNFHKVALTFESFDSQWQKDPKTGGLLRTRNPKMGLSSLVSARLRGTLKPLDGLVDRAVADSSKRKTQGKFGKWATNNLETLVNKVGVDKYKEMVKTRVVALRDDMSHKWWTADRNTIYIPEAYPAEVIGSFWEETALSNGKKLIDYIESDPPQAIPWELVSEAQADPLEKYVSKVNAAIKLNNYLISTGDKSLTINPSIFGGNEGAVAFLQSWGEGVMSVLPTLEQGDNLWMKQIVFYASAGVKADKELLYLDWTNDNKRTLKDIMTGKGYIYGRPRPEIFDGADALFRWDKNKNW